MTDSIKVDYEVKTTDGQHIASLSMTLSRRDITDDLICNGDCYENPLDYLVQEITTHFEYLDLQFIPSESSVQALEEEVEAIASDMDKPEKQVINNGGRFITIYT
ncbi:hypothetical protein VZG28_04860 [Synechococcus elongatus IITB4]|uniref:hypothetical protein n=1 Tax=Synechococcus elongatus TaxID=32046 RepID=UPI0030CB15C8